MLPFPNVIYCWINTLLNNFSLLPNSDHIAFLNSIFHTFCSSQAICTSNHGPQREGHAKVFSFTR
jgi:hypothetical protein